MQVLAEEQALDHWWLKRRYRRTGHAGSVLLQLYRSVCLLNKLLLERPVKVNSSQSLTASKKCKAALLRQSSAQIYYTNQGIRGKSKRVWTCLDVFRLSQGCIQASESLICKML